MQDDQQSNLMTLLEEFYLMEQSQNKDKREKFLEQFTNNLSGKFSKIFILKNYVAVQKIIKYYIKVYLEEAEQRKSIERVLQLILKEIDFRQEIFDEIQNFCQENQEFNLSFLPLYQSIISLPNLLNKFILLSPQSNTCSDLEKNEVIMKISLNMDYLIEMKCILIEDGIIMECFNPRGFGYQLLLEQQKFIIVINRINEEKIRKIFPLEYQKSEKMEFLQFRCKAQQSLQKISFYLGYQNQFEMVQFTFNNNQPSRMSSFKIFNNIYGAFEYVYAIQNCSLREAFDFQNHSPQFPQFKNKLILYYFHMQRAILEDNFGIIEDPFNKNSLYFDSSSSQVVNNNTRNADFYFKNQIYEISLDLLNRVENEDQLKVIVQGILSIFRNDEYLEEYSKIHQESIFKKFVGGLLGTKSRKFFNQEIIELITDFMENLPKNFQQEYYLNVLMNYPLIKTYQQTPDHFDCYLHCFYQQINQNKSFKRSLDKNSIFQLFAMTLNSSTQIKNIQMVIKVITNLKYSLVEKGVDFRPLINTFFEKNLNDEQIFQILNLFDFLLNKSSIEEFLKEIKNAYLYLLYTTHNTMIISKVIYYLMSFKTDEKLIDKFLNRKNQDKNTRQLLSQLCQFFYQENNIDKVTQKKQKLLKSQKKYKNINIKLIQLLSEKDKIQFFQILIFQFQCNQKKHLQKLKNSNILEQCLTIISQDCVDQALFDLVMKFIIIFLLYSHSRKEDNILKIFKFYLEKKESKNIKIIVLTVLKGIKDSSINKINDFLNSAFDFYCIHLINSSSNSSSEISHLILHLFVKNFTQQKLNQIIKKGKQEILLNFLQIYQDNVHQEQPFVEIFNNQAIKFLTKITFKIENQKKEENLDLLREIFKKIIKIFFSFENCKKQSLEVLKLLYAYTQNEKIDKETSLCAEVINGSNLGLELVVENLDMIYKIMSEFCRVSKLFKVENQGDQLKLERLVSITKNDLGELEEDLVMKIITMGKFQNKNFRINYSISQEIYYKEIIHSYFKNSQNLRSMGGPFFSQQIQKQLNKLQQATNDFFLTAQDSEFEFHQRNKLTQNFQRPFTKIKLKNSQFEINFNEKLISDEKIEIQKFLENQNLKFFKIFLVKNLKIKFYFLVFKKHHMALYKDQQNGKLELMERVSCLKEDLKKTDLLLRIISYDSIKQILQYKFLQQKNSWQIWTHSRKQYLMVFESEKLKKQAETIVSSFIKSKMVTNNTKRFMKLNYHNQWSDNEISNFKYLMLANIFSCRSYQDYSQYPIFPLIIRDFKNNFHPRNLSKPIGMIGDYDRQKSFKEKFKSSQYFEEIPEYHYGSHYSSPSIVFHYMIRMQPYTMGNKDLMDDKFDLPDRIFFSISHMFRNVKKELNDVRELIPELYYFPSLFLNLNHLDLGENQKGQNVSTVQFPQQIHQDRFVSKMRDYLENKESSCSLNKWIDLIFGIDQQGENAKQKMNLFYCLSYEKYCQEQIQENKPEIPVLTQVYHFGQCPRQIFTQEHCVKKFNQNNLKLVSNGVSVQYFIKKFISQVPKNIMGLKIFDNQIHCIIDDHYEIFKIIKDQEGFISLGKIQSTKMSVFGSQEYQMKITNDFIRIAVLMGQNIVLLGGLGGGEIQIVNIKNSKKNIFQKIHTSSISQIKTNSLDNVITCDLLSTVKLFKLQSMQLIPLHSFYCYQNTQVEEVSFCESDEKFFIIQNMKNIDIRYCDSPQEILFRINLNEPSSLNMSIMSLGYLPCLVVLKNQEISSFSFQGLIIATQTLQINSNVIKMILGKDECFRDNLILVLGNGNILIYDLPFFENGRLLNHPYSQSLVIKDAVYCEVQNSVFIADSNGDINFASLVD